MTKVIGCCMLMVPIKSEPLLSLFFLLLFFLSFFFVPFFWLKFRIIFFYPKHLFPRWAMSLQSNGLFLSRKVHTQVTEVGGGGGKGGWGHKVLEILKKEHVQILGVNTIQGVFMKNSWNFHGLSWFQLWNFHQKGVSHNFEEFAGVKACFLEVPKVTYLKISVFFRKVYTGVEIRENVLTGHQLPVGHLLKCAALFGE